MDTHKPNGDDSSLLGNNFLGKSERDIKNEDEDIMSDEEYRAITKDKDIAKNDIKKRRQYLIALCRNIIQLEFKNYDESSKD